MPLRRAVHALIAGVSALVLATMPVAGSAHALLARSQPAQRATLSQPPSQVRLWFSETLEPAFCSIDVVSADGKRVSERPARVSTQDGKLLELDLPKLGPGVYAVQYSVVSIDGHAVKAVFRFTVRGP
jgi:methionine-rich copper-binding protein CopC